MFDYNIILRYDSYKTKAELDKMSEEFYLKWSLSSSAFTTGKFILSLSEKQYRYLKRDLMKIFGKIPDEIMALNLSHFSVLLKIEN